MKKLFALLLAAVMIVSLFACSPKDPDPQKDPDPKPPVEEIDYEATLVYGITQDWNTINFYAGAPTAAIYMVTDKIFDKLWYKDVDGKITGRNAESWEWNSDNTVLTIKLNKNAKWHDGQPVTAYDWEFTYTLMCQKDAGYAKPSNNRFFLGTDDNGFAVEGQELGIKATDDYTLVLSFKQNMIGVAEMLQTCNLLQTPVIPKHLLGEKAVADVYKDAFFDNPVGSGPCKFVSQVVNSELKLEANQDYYLGRPGFKTLTIKKMDTAGSLAALKTGEVDAVFPRYSSDNAIECMASAADGSYVAEMDATPTRVAYILINNKNVADARIRQAIQLVLDRDAICKNIMSNTAEGTATYVAKNNPNKIAIDYKPDAAKAEALLKEAGYSKDKPLTLKMDTVTGFRTTISALLQQELEKIGIKLEVIQTTAAASFKDIVAGTVDLAWIVDSVAAGDLGAEWYYNNNNPAGYNQIQIDDYDNMMAKVKEAQKNNDAAALKKAMEDWQKFAYEQAPMITLFFMYGVNGRSNRLSGAALGDIAYSNDNIWAWKIIKK